MRRTHVQQFHVRLRASAHRPPCPAARPASSLGGHRLRCPRSGNAGRFGLGPASAADGLARLAVLAARGERRRRCRGHARVLEFACGLGARRRDALGRDVDGPAQASSDRPGPRGQSGHRRDRPGFVDARRRGARPAAAAGHAVGRHRRAHGLRAPRANHRPARCAGPAARGGRGRAGPLRVADAAHARDPHAGPRRCRCCGSARRDRHRRPAAPPPGGLPPQRRIVDLAGR